MANRTPKLPSILLQNKLFNEFPSPINRPNGIIKFLVIPFPSLRYYIIYYLIYQLIRMKGVCNEFSEKG